MTDRKQVLTFVGGALLLVLFGVAYLVYASIRVDDDLADREARAQAAIDDFEEQGGLVGQAAADAIASDEAAQAEAEAAAAAGPGPQPGEVLVVHRVPGDDYGRLAIRHADGTRTLLDRRCLRVHAAGGVGVCLAQDDSPIVATFRTTYFDTTDDRFVDIRSYASPLPSRARVSPDGSIVSTTAFVSGTSYADIGGDTETIALVDIVDDRNELAGLVQYEVDADDARYSTADRQYWGVTFDGPDEFWVTGWFGDEPEIMRGDRLARTVSPTGWKGSCPSLSPDGSTLVFKETQPDDSFRLVAVDLDSGERWTLGETRSVDDQVEWLDDDTILYALHPDGTDGLDVQPQFDLWSLDIAPGSTPELFLPAADSPAVIRGS